MGEEGGKESEEREKVLYSYELKIAWGTCGHMQSVQMYNVL